MTIPKAAFICLFGMLTSSTFAPATEGWRGIVPLHSTRADVERLFGSPLQKGGSSYATETEVLIVAYSADESCREGLPDRWNVPRDTVLSFTVSPRTKLLLSDTHLNISSFRRLPDPYIQGNIYYRSEEEDVKVTTRALQDGTEEVDSIRYTPAATDNHLRCPGSKTVLRGINVHHLRVFNSYFDISFSEEKRHLDNFAIELSHETESVGYYVIYAGRRARAGEAQKRGERAKKYVVEKHGINAERIVFIDGGHREDLHIELYVLPRDALVPPAVPMVAPSKVQIIDDEKDKEQ